MTAHGQKKPHTALSPAARATLSPHHHTHTHTYTHIHTPSHTPSHTYGRSCMDVAQSVTPWRAECDHTSESVLHASARAPVRRHCWRGPGSSRSECWGSHRRTPLCRRKSGSARLGDRDAVGRSSTRRLRCMPSHRHTLRIDALAGMQATCPCTLLYTKSLPVRDTVVRDSPQWTCNVHKVR
jgi:hypothetical protein